jgi:hypothetical protein
MNYYYKKYIWFFIIGIGILFLMYVLMNTFGIGFDVDISNDRIVEGFNAGEFNFKPVPGFKPWPKDLIRRFNIYQKTINENSYQYNMYVLQQIATADEAETLLKTGFWPWSSEIQDLYIKAVSQSTHVKIDPKEALNSAMKNYCEMAVKRQLGWGAKEGQFLIYGADIGRTGTMPINNTIKCSSDLEKSVLQKTVYSGYNLWNGYKNSTRVDIKNEDIPSEIPGFSFVNGACNPCVAINQAPQYSCPFKLVTENDSEISPIWSNLWNLS